MKEDKRFLHPAVEAVIEELQPIIDDPDRSDDVLFCLISKKGSLLPGVLIDHSDVTESDEDNGDGYQEDDEEKKIKRERTVSYPGGHEGMSPPETGLLDPVLHSRLYLPPGMKVFLHLKMEDVRTGQIFNWPREA
jgi:hypothetical protein